MTLRWFVLAALCACGLVAAPADALATPSRAALELSSAGKRALSARSISVPRSSTFSIRSWTVGSSAKIGLDGALRFSAGKRKVSASGLQVTISRTSSYVTARLGTKSVRLFTVTPTKPAVLDAPGKRVSLVGARVALTRAAATTLKARLKLQRAPSTAALGKLTVAVAPELVTPPATLPAPAPASTPAPTATPEPTATPTPGGGPACADRFAATPGGSVDWFGCDLPGNGDLHSWTDYVQRPFQPLPGCGSAPGTVVASAGATRVVPDTAYDHRLPIASTTFDPGGSVTIVTQGTITYTMPAHGIDERIGALRIEIAADRQTGIVYADGYAKPRDMGGGVCATAPQDYTNQPVLTLDLAGIAPVTAGGVTRWVHVPAKIADGSERIGGGVYGAGAAWGSFTIAVPER